MHMLLGIYLDVSKLRNQFYLCRRIDNSLDNSGQLEISTDNYPCYEANILLPDILMSFEKPTKKHIHLALKRSNITKVEYRKKAGTVFSSDCLRCGKQNVIIVQ